MSEIMGVEHRVFTPGGLHAFRFLIRLTRLFVPGKRELSPVAGNAVHARHASGVSKFEPVDNERYPVVFGSVKDLLAKHLREKKELTRNELRVAKTAYHVPLAGILARGAISMHCMFTESQALHCLMRTTSCKICIFIPI
jgi:hypothetical protein